MDDERHRRGTGVSNALILANFDKVCDAFPGLTKIVRTPIIPGFNATSAEVVKISRFLRCRANVEHELMPYHRLGQPKYESLGRSFPQREARLDKALFDELRRMAQAEFSRA